MSARQYLPIIQHGLQPKADRPRKVVILGAGMAGLVAGYELLRAGHDPLILEARPRAGGRVQTLRDPFSHGLYAEAGAMRIPKSHVLTMAYIEEFGLGVTPFVMNNRRAYYYFRGQRHRVEDATAAPECLGFEVAEHERGKTAAQLWREALRPIVERLRAGDEEDWPQIIAEYDELSTREFLKQNGWSEGAIEMFGLVENQESRIHTSFIEQLLADTGEVFRDMYRIDGGMDRLPQAFMPELQSRIRFGAQVIALDQSPGAVEVHYTNAAGRARVTGDYGIITLPFSVMCHIEILKPFSWGKRRAIRELNYDHSAKVFLQCRRRFWEEDEGIIGGGTVTDLAVRNIYYPEHGRETGRGVLLASYTWAEDAERWGSLEPEDRIIQALEDVAQIHPQVNEALEGGASKVWHNDPFACGAFALFEPGQKTDLHEHIIAPEGRYHFAGEHTSLTHRWVQGAIESGLRAASEVHQAAVRA